MSLKKIFAVLLSIIMVLICLPLSVSAEPIAKDEPEYVEGEILITSAKEVEDNNGSLQTASQSDTIGIDFDEAGIESINELETYTDEENVYVAEVDGDVEEICAVLNESGDVIAEPNYILHTVGFTMPSEITNNLSIYKNYQKWYFNEILHIPEAWTAHEVIGRGVTVAVIDDGFYVNAPDFPTNLWLNSNGTPGWNTYKNNDDISPIFKKSGAAFGNTAHGSNVAGIIGMPANGTGGIGAAYGAELMLLQAANYVSESSQPSFTSSAVVSAIDFARENGADIINLSLGSSSNVSAISSAVTRAYNAGILVVAAAGNGDSNGKGIPTSTQKFYPAANSNVLGVMAIDKDSPTQLSYFSNYDTNNGTYYDIAAPGVSIVGCNCTDSSYTLNNGTSQATPLVAAICALYMEKYPDHTIQELKSNLLASATDYVHENGGTTRNFKSINALKFLNYCSPPEIVVNMTTDANIYGSYLQGLDEGYTDITDYISVTEGTGTMVFTPSENGNGTGSRIDFYNTSNRLFRTLTVVIFGDVNGDCYINGEDAVIVNCNISGMTGSTFTDAQEHAADVNLDSIVGNEDTDMIEQHAVMNYEISQT